MNHQRLYQSASFADRYHTSLWCAHEASQAREFGRTAKIQGESKRTSQIKTTEIRGSNPFCSTIQSL